MAMSNKEAAIRAIAGLPDDASTEDILYTMYVRSKIGEGPRDESAGNLIDYEAVKREIDRWLRSGGKDDDSNLDAVTYHLEREGWATVLVPDRPVPPITAEMVNEVIEEMRREREGHWLGSTEDDGE